MAASTKVSLWSEDIDCVVVPVNACGGAGTLAFSKKKKHKVLPSIITIHPFFLVKSIISETYKVEVKMAGFGDNSMQPLLIAVEENKTVLNDTPEKMEIDMVSVYFVDILAF
jgi:hypothetical protein